MSPGSHNAVLDYVHGRIHLAGLLLGVPLRGRRRMTLGGFGTHSFPSAHDSRLLPTRFISEAAWDVLDELYSTGGMYSILRSAGS